MRVRPIHCAPAFPKMSENLSVPLAPLLMNVKGQRAGTLVLHPSKGAAEVTMPAEVARSEMNAKAVTRLRCRQTCRTPGVALSMLSF
jgi:hypothetical protein